MGRVTLTAPAQTDLDAIWDYIARDNLTAADRLIDQIDERAHVFADQPEAGTPGDRFQPGLRYFVAGSYVVFYRSEEAGILIVRVLHGARDLRALFND